MKVIKKIILGSTVWFFSNMALAQNLLTPSYPTIPPSYETLRPGKLINNAQVNFPAYTIRHTNGYKVTTPEGNEFVVDNIAQPKCAFYATYVATDEEGFLGVNSVPSTPIVSNVYIGEVNFDKCQ